MLAEVTAACEALGAALSAVDPSVLPGAHCAHLVEALARIEKRCGAVRAMAAARAAECDAFRERGFSDPAAWLAHASGVADGEARSALSTAEALASCPQTRDALLAGEVSLAQAAEITKTEKAVPGSETDLLELAGRTGIGGLREAGRKLRLEAKDRDDHHRRQRRERYLRHWQDDHGMIRLSGAFTPDVGVALTNRIDAETDRLVRAGRADSGGGPDGDCVPDDGGTDASERGDTREQLAADAFAMLILEGGRAPRARGAEVVLVCDVRAFWRGHTHPGEVCHVIGGGPVPVSVVWEQRYDAFIKAVLHDGVAIDTVAHFGRHITAELRTALGLGEPPDFDGAVCAVEGCDRRYHLEWDHVDPFAHGGPTSYGNLRPLCKPHHWDKTRRDREDGLIGGRPPGRPSGKGGPDLPP